MKFLLVQLGRQFQCGVGFPEVAAEPRGHPQVWVLVREQHLLAVQLAEEVPLYVMNIPVAGICAPGTALI